jgi:hypothetical protein
MLLRADSNEGRYTVLVEPNSINKPNPIEPLRESFNHTHLLQDVPYYP